MPTQNVSRRDFLSKAALGAALGSAALAVSPRGARASESDVFYTQAEWNSGAFTKLLRAKRDVKQIIDLTAPDGVILAIHANSMLTGLERGFGVPADRILVVAALHAEANTLNFDDYAWKKYQIGAWLNVHDPVTKKPAERNIYNASTIAPNGKYASEDPNDHRSEEWDWSLQAIRGRGVQFLGCHLATEIAALEIVKRLKLKSSVESVADDLMAHTLPGVIWVPSVVSAIPIMETHGHFTYLRL